MGNAAIDNYYLAKMCSYSIILPRLSHMVTSFVNSVPIQALRADICCCCSNKVVLKFQGTRGLPPFLFLMASSYSFQKTTGNFLVKIGGRASESVDFMKYAHKMSTILVRTALLGLTVF